jgi:PhzF family phenazine biosynthesis protein
MAMELNIYQVDAFTRDLFAGNPAAVCPLKDWLSDELMQRIAAENNLSETAFIVPEGEGHRIRWFTPLVEVDLCGHATIATAYVLFQELGYPGPTLRFQSRSGLLEVTRDSNGAMTLDFPADPPALVTEVPATLFAGLKIGESPVMKGKFDYLVVLDSQEQVEALKPDFPLLSVIPARGIIVTAPGKRHDFVSRCFFPATGVDEDPVTGSAHCLLTSYWAQRTGRDHFRAAQLSARGGEVECRLSGTRVLMTGNAVLYLKGKIFIS